jgi:hypothetical protein
MFQQISNAETLQVELSEFVSDLGCPFQAASALSQAIFRVNPD